MLFGCVALRQIICVLVLMLCQGDEVMTGEMDHMCNSKHRGVEMSWKEATWETKRQEESNIQI